MEQSGSLSGQEISVYNKKAFFITMISLTIGCGLALGSSVIVKGVDLQNQFMKEPDFQIRITQEACRTLMETSPDTENMVFSRKNSWRTSSRLPEIVCRMKQRSRDFTLLSGNKVGIALSY